MENVILWLCMLQAYGVVDVPGEASSKRTKVTSLCNERNSLHIQLSYAHQFSTQWWLLKRSSHKGPLLSFLVYTLDLDNSIKADLSNERSSRSRRYRSSIFRRSPVHSRHNMVGLFQMFKTPVLYRCPITRS
jgi:hypothetical protein